jgi:hypothetical protein
LLEFKEFVCILFNLEDSHSRESLFLTEITGDIKVKGRKISRQRKINFVRIEAASAARNLAILPKTT